MRGLLGAFVAGAALWAPVATAEPHDCASVDRARVQIRQLSQENGVAVRQTAVTRNRATAALLRTAAGDTSDPAVRDRALEAAAAAERYANVLAAATSVDGVLEPPGEEGRQHHGRAGTGVPDLRRLGLFGVRQAPGGGRLGVLDTPPRHQCGRHRGQSRKPIQGVGHR
ncbi:Hypothetical protein ERS075557_00153 [Mycobacteroides abscessus]|nr:Hypothetical protein ERS075557_00153 [Mycobacteroides abscessus]CPX22587.1 Hypothetical protein ERS075608_00120 [Mycobacteroides abscessus]CPZ31715.1 Hypothetical protein ERS075649_00380 [Mycobacteroides abscessus]